ncbi:DMT family transporter [Paenibacillus koleovorans]|uniref:DMT family transporter n=1 Tax=Paenibacillus koleovorans TaxID=121608 RepID=UPI000FD707A3|nr:DMT family transporter [Paenibacillus koleovorans]
MGYLFLLLATLSWSFVGILVKAASTMVDSTTITFARFSIGVVFLGLFLLLKGKGLRLQFRLRWIWLGALGKALNNYLENIGLSIGYSYGYILVSPVSTVLLLLVSYFLLKERISVRGRIAAAMCVAGVFVISWNGKPLGDLFGADSLTTLIFLISGVGATFHVLSQNLLAKDMEPGEMNFSVFFWASLVMMVPLPWQFEFHGNASISSVGALVLLGLITGISFYWFSLGLAKVPFSVAVILSNSSVLFAILWSFLIYRDPITTYIVGGATLFTAGMVVLNLPVGHKRIRRQVRSESEDKSLPK